MDIPSHNMMFIYEVLNMKF